MMGKTAPKITGHFYTNTITNFKIILIQQGTIEKGRICSVDHIFQIYAEKRFAHQSWTPDMFLHNW